MYISSLKIRNFRNFLASEFVFNKGVNTVLGENGSGKSNALYTLRLLLDDSLPRNIVKLYESDFCRNLSSWRGHWIILSVDFSELTVHEGCQTLKHLTGHMEGEGRGTLTYYFRPNLIIRKKLFESNDDFDEVKQVLDSIVIDDYEAIFTGRSTANFLSEESYKELVGDFDRNIFPNPENLNFDAYGVKIYPVHEEVSFTFVKALRDVVSDLKNHRSSPLLSLLKGLESEIDEVEAVGISALVSELNGAISSLDQIKSLSKGIQSTLHNTVGYTFSPVIDIQSSLPSGLDKLLQKLSLTVGDNYIDGYSGDLSELSLGGANLIYIALKLLEYERKQEAEKAGQFLIIEEPEAHIHTHIQKTLFEKHSTGKTQVFLSTHSTHISSVAKISEMNILGLESGEVDVFQPANGISQKESGRIERYLNATRSTLLFAKGVVLVEGDAELIIIPALVKNVLGVSLDELGISLINMESAFFEHVSKLFNTKRIRKCCAIITDSDESIVVLPDDPEDDTDYQRDCRNSQNSGQQRKAALDDLIAGNMYVKAFYAMHTFEVDFIMADNSREVIEVLSSIYSKPANITASKNKLSNSNIDIYGKEVLRLAEKVGKGWFSLLLAEKISSQVFIPPYILAAIAFACGGRLSEQVLYKMCVHRLRNPMPILEDKEKPIAFFKANRIDLSSCINEFLKVCPDDDLSLLINLLRR
ncbi:AAA family ATPase [Pseudomonas sp. 43A]|uniref:ATP-dependent nuclease n=1 Tax=unclassified Pseudomonas TaxID=196821 RepID=UPI0015874F39|nr:MULTISPECIES: AAA family ATPase [unclassified Pseudomonas]QKV64843.1 AAA family ATPase [Pseudomonas sp. 43A]QMW12703.1 AAA family ATPase [Pseudomonas sp. 29A]